MIQSLIGGMFLGFVFFAFGLGIGWNIRGQVKEQELSRHKQTLEELERLRWKINEHLEGE